MIPRAYIIEWQKSAPWQNNAQVEQDLVIERALIELFSNNFLREHLAFRGGTALHKLFLKPQARYSEDIDLVQIKTGPIKQILQEIRNSMKFLGTKRETEVTIHNATAKYAFDTEIEPVIRAKLKFEINTREHFSVLGWEHKDYTLNHSYFKGEASLTTYKLEELVGTKMRALFQRSKGRDLFDLYYVLTNIEVDKQTILTCYKEYMNFDVKNPPTSKEFILNMDDKMKRAGFQGDIVGLLRPEIKYNMNDAYDLIKKELLEKI